MDAATKPWVYGLLFSALLFFSPSLPGQEFVGDDGLELDGLVIDRTLTPPGHDFYDHFVATWRDMAAAELRRANLVVTERPSIRSGSVLSIEHNHRIIFRTFLQPRRADMKPLAEKAAQVAQMSIINHARNAALWVNGDLSGDGF